MRSPTWSEALPGGADLGLFEEVEPERSGVVEAELAGGEAV